MDRKDEIVNNIVTQILAQYPPAIAEKKK
jgi:hypothetical protein